MKLIFSSLLMAASTLSASPLITYEFSGTASGIIGGTSFADASIVVTGTTDPASVVCTSGTCTAAFAGGAASFTIGGIGSGVFNGTTYFFDNQPSNVAGFGDNSAPVHCCDIIQLEDAVFNTYDLQSAIGPIGPAATNPSILDWDSLDTSLGAFTLRSMTNYSFTATVADTETPEPSTAILWVSGLTLVMAGARRRRSS